MGGNALSLQTARLSRFDYFSACEHVVSRLRETFPDNRVAAIEAYRTKPENKKEILHHE